MTIGKGMNPCEKCLEMHIIEQEHGQLIDQLNSKRSMLCGKREVTPLQEANNITFYLDGIFSPRPFMCVMTLR